MKSGLDVSVIYLKSLSLWCSDRWLWTISTSELETRVLITEPQISSTEPLYKEAGQWAKRAPQAQILSSHPLFNQKKMKSIYVRSSPRGFLTYRDSQRCPHTYRSAFCNIHTGTKLVFINHALPPQGPCIWKAAQNSLTALRHSLLRIGWKARDTAPLERNGSTVLCSGLSQLWLEGSITL